MKQLNNLTTKQLFYSLKSVYNPFTFDTERLNGRVNEMVLDLSNRILIAPLSSGQATIEYALCEKFRKLDDLIFILSNWGLIDTLETTTKLSLCYNSSTILAALGLWKYQNKFTKYFALLKHPNSFEQGKR